MAERTEELMALMGQIADYAAMIHGCMQQLQAAGLSKFGAEAVLLNVLGIPGYESEEDYDDED